MGVVDGESTVGATRSAGWPTAIGSALATAFAYAVSFPDRPLPWLGWVVFAPLLWGCRRVRPLRGLVAGLLFGWLLWLTSIWWSVVPLRRITLVPVPAGVALVGVLCLFFGLPHAVTGVLASAWRLPAWPLRALRDAAVLTVATYYVPVVFPGGVVQSQWRHPRALQVLELGGVPLLLFLMGLTSALVAEAFPPGRPFARPMWRRLAAALGVVAAVFGYGALRLAHLDADQAAGRGSWLTVGTVQPNLPIPVEPDLQPSGTAAYQNDVTTAAAQARELVHAHPEVDVVVFPEWPPWIVPGSGSDEEGTLVALARDIRRPLLVNVSEPLAVDPEPSPFLAEGPETERRTNAMGLLDSSGAWVAIYRKMLLVPGTERWPLWESWPRWLRRLVPPALGIVAGDAPVVFPLGPRAAVIPALCYEGIHAQHLRRFVALGGNVIVNGSNDTWFLRTPATVVHGAVAMFRAAELRVPMVRVANSGLSFCVGADGRIVPDSEMALFANDARAVRLFVPEARSPYSRWGDVLPPALLLLLAVSGAWTLASRRVAARAPVVTRPSGGDDGTKARAPFERDRPTRRRRGEPG